MGGGGLRWCAEERIGLSYFCSLVFHIISLTFVSPAHVSFSVNVCVGGWVGVYVCVFVCVYR